MMTPGERAAADVRAEALFRSLLSPEELAEWEPTHALLLRDARGRRYVLHGPRRGCFIVEFIEGQRCCFTVPSHVPWPPCSPCWDLLATGYLAIKYGDGLLYGIAGFGRLGGAVEVLPPRPRAP